VQKSLSIIVVESSPVIYEGLAVILNKAGLKLQISHAGSLEEMELLYAKHKSQLIIVNPSFIINNTKTFNNIKENCKNVKWAGLVYAYHDPKILSSFDALIYISDSSETIINTVNKILAEKNSQGEKSLQEKLSERETDVIKLIVTGLSNKEIAEKLNISINTVITHRKNISQKTGIKSVSGLTIYAVVQNIVSLESLAG